MPPARSLRRHRPAAGRHACRVVAVVVAAVLAGGPAAAQDPAAAPTDGSGAVAVAPLTSPALASLEVLTDGRTAAGVVGGPSDALLMVPVTSERYDRAVGVRDRIVAEVGDAQVRYADAVADLERLATERVALASLLPRAVERAAKVQAYDRIAQKGVAAMAVAMYVGDTAPMLLPDDTLSPDERLDAAHRVQIAATASDRSIDYSRRARRRVLVTAGRVAELQQASLDNDAAVTEQTRRRDTAVADFEDAARRAVTAEVEVRAARALADVDGTDLTLVALDAYWRAARSVELESPECGLSWWGLAGVGRSESDHGRFGGRSVGIDGQVDSPVIGIALDGNNATRLIADTDGGRLDGDVIFDRAVGPMQFIPSTWARWGADLSGNEVADPQNFYDATLAAARYLCAYGPLDTDEGLRRAYFGYNRSLAYVQLVLSRAHGYRDTDLGLS